MEDLMYSILVHGNSVIAWVGAFAVALIGKYVIAKIESDKVRGVAGRALTEVDSAVEEVWVTYVEALKEGAADGNLTDDEKQEAKDRAIAIAKTNLGAKGVERLLRILGVDNVDGWLGTKVEAAVSRRKLAEKVAAAPVWQGPAPLPLP